MASTRNVSPYIASMVFHALVLLVMWMIRNDVLEAQADIAVETIFEDERAQEEFSQDLEVETDIAETLNTVSGGVVSTAVGSAVGPTVSQTKIETSESLKDPEISVNVGEFTTVGDDVIGVDLGVGEVKGEVGAFVTGYGEALSRMTQEIIRMMRKDKLLVCWLFDESDSMKDDQVEIQAKFHKVYEELGIITKKDKELRKKGDDVLLTAILSYGKAVNLHTKKPTAVVNEIRSAIGKIKIDESGKENMCQAIAQTIDRFGKQARGANRKLVLIVISDESGDDGQFVEETLGRAKKIKAPIYVMAREAVFGYPYARIRWQDPVYNLWHWLRINRGPETAFPECLQWDGLRARYDAFSSGFGPYEMVRLAKESGGIFFVLPGEEEDLTGPGAQDRRKFESLDMKEYEPLLLARREYEQQRSRSKFRQTVWQVIVTLNPHLDNQLNLRESYFSVLPVEFAKQGKTEFPKAIRAMSLTQQALKMLENVRPLRAKEKSQRWRANYDLVVAQLLSYRVRLFQYLLNIDAYLVNFPKPKLPKSNVWHIRRVRKMLPPTEKQVKLTKVDTAELDSQKKLAEKLYQFVISEHPRTPWARRANYEMSMGFGMEFREAFHDPRYRDLGKKIKLPKP